MKTQGLEAQFSQNLAPVGARKATKTLPCLHFTFIKQAPFWAEILAKNITKEFRSLFLVSFPIPNDGIIPQQSDNGSLGIR